MDKRARGQFALNLHSPVGRSILGEESRVKTGRAADSTECSSMGSFGIMRYHEACSSRV